MIGETLGRYHIVSEIGRGGMGVVYRAHDDSLDRDVAIKVLPDGLLADESSRKRFRKEALALAKLNHPNIGSVYEFSSQNNADFLVMEHIPGVTLSDKLAAGHLPEKEILRLGVQLAEALAAAHEQGIVHCDLKPANLRLTPEGRLKILDFGLAKLVRPASREALTATLTETHTVGGTLPYMAPEQLRGEPVDPRTDLYALGTVLYELATGQRTFPETQAPLLIDSILHHAPVAPRALNRALSAELERIILKALDKDPERRYQTAREMRVDLERLLSPTSAEAAPRQPARFWERTRRTSRAHPWRTSLAVVIVVGAVAALVRFAILRPVLSFAPRDWILLTDFDNQTGDPLFDRSLLTALTVSLAQSAHANIFSRASVGDTLRRMGKAPTIRIDEELGREICQRESIRALLSLGIARAGAEYAVSAQLVDPQTGAAVRSYLGRAKEQNRILGALDDIAAQLRHDLGESLDAIQKNDRPLPRVTTSSLQALKQYADGNDAWEKGKFTEGVQLFKEALRLDPDFAESHAALGNAYYSSIFNQPVNGKSEYELALKLTDRTTDRERMAIQANYASAQGHAHEAVDQFQVYLDKWPDDWRMRYNLGGLLRENGREQEAIEQYKQVIRIAPTDASAYINLATSLSSLDQLPEALEYYGEAFKLEPTWITSGNLNHEYGFTLVRAGKEDEARKVFAMALDKPELRGHAQRSLGLLALYHGHYREGRGRLEEALLSDKADKAILSVAREHVYLSIVAEGQGDRGRCVRELDEAAKIVPQVEAKVWMGSLVGREYARCGATQKARRIFEVIKPAADPNSPEQSSQLHLLEGEIALLEGKKPQAMESFLLADKEKRTLMTLDGMARGYQAAGDLERAIASYEQMAGLAGNSLGWEVQQDWIADHYFLAMAYAARGDKTKAAASLGSLLEIWRDADPDIPILQQAKAESAKLK